MEFYPKNTHKQNTLHADEPKEHAAETESKISLEIEAWLGSEVRCAKYDVRRATIERRLRRVWLRVRQYEWNDGATKVSLFINWSGDCGMWQAEQAGSETRRREGATCIVDAAEIINYWHSQLA